MPGVSVPPREISEHRYGDAPAQVCELHLPGGPPHAVAVLVHGGFWRARYDRTQEHAVAADLVARGWAVWNIDYRGVGEGPLGVEAAARVAAVRWGGLVKVISSLPLRGPRDNASSSRSGGAAPSRVWRRRGMGTSP